MYLLAAALAIMLFSQPELRDYKSEEEGEALLQDKGKGECHGYSISETASMV